MELADTSTKRSPYLCRVGISNDTKKLLGGPEVHGVKLPAPTLHATRA